MEERTLELATHCSVTDLDDSVVQWDKRENCEVRQILDRLADNWSLLVLSLLDQRTYRFNELQRRLGGISHRMLTITLRQLERDGMLSRKVHPTVPPKVEYSLTTLGAQLHGLMRPLVSWTEANTAAITSARRDFDHRYREE
jgi:DNA-binding HxlR family transcriptional regulator